MNITQALNWRYATKKFDTEKKLSDEQLLILTEALRLSPSSFGLQPWKFLIISNPDIRSKLREAGYGQPQITDASHLVVFAVPTGLTDSLADEHIAEVAKATGQDVSALAAYRDMMAGAINNIPTMEARTAWAARQAYIALGVLLAAAATEGIDAGPMEGFNPVQFDEILGLKEKGLTTVVIAALGFRSPDDAYIQMPKVRFPRERVIEEIK